MVLEILNPKFCYGSPPFTEGLCIGAWWFVVLFVIGIIIYKILTPKKKLN